jgi:hypothetical protein
LDGAAADLLQLPIRRTVDTRYVPRVELVLRLVPNYMLAPARAAEVEAAVETDLRREWGEAFEPTLHNANRAIAEIGGAELGKLLSETRMADGTRMGNHPLLVKAFAEIGKRLAEPGDLRGGGSGAASAPASPETALAEIKALTTDTAFHAARRDPRHPDHAKNTARWAQLNAAAAAGQSWVA